MSRQIQQPTEAQALAEWYRIQGGLKLRLDEVVVPVHIVADTSPKGDSADFQTGEQREIGWQTTWNGLCPAGGAGQVTYAWIQNLFRDAPLGNEIQTPNRIVRIDWFEIWQGGTGAFFHAGLGNNTGADLPTNLLRTALTQTAPPVRRQSTGGYQSDGTSLQIAVTSLAAGPFPGLELLQWNKALGNLIYSNRIHLGWELGELRRGAAGSELGNDTFWILNGTSNQNFGLNIQVTVFPSLAELRV